MPAELAAKVRLVRCPKCRLLLPEFPHYNVYKCGGCGTTLQGNNSLILQNYSTQANRSNMVYSFALLMMLLSVDGSLMHVPVFVNIQLHKSGY